MDLEKPQKEVLVRVLKEVGYHDDHQVGEVIRIQETHLKDMVEEGFVELLY